MDSQQPVQQANSQPVQQSFQPKSHSAFSKSLFMIFGVMIVLGLTSGAYYLGTKQQNSSLKLNEKTKSAGETVTIITTPTLTPTPNPTANWQTYNLHGFSLRYPQAWIVKEERYNPLQIFFYNPSTAIRGGNGGNDIIYPDSLQVTAAPGVAGETIQEWIDGVSSKALKDQFQRKTIMLNGEQIEVYHVGGEGIEGWYIPFTKGQGFEILGPLAVDPEQDSLELEIVKTFKFTQ